MNDIKYIVYIQIDENNCITDVNSSVFIDEKDLDNWIEIDEGIDGDIYGHAQPNYLFEKYGKYCYDEKWIPNFKYENFEVKELTSEEKETLFPSITPEPQPSLEELQKQIAEQQKIINALLGTEE